MWAKGHIEGIIFRNLSDSVLNHDFTLFLPILLVSTLLGNQITKYTMPSPPSLHLLDREDDGGHKAAAHKAIPLQNVWAMCDEGGGHPNDDPDQYLPHTHHEGPCLIPAQFLCLRLATPLDLNAHSFLINH